jgi:hypothetical protein
MSSPGVLHFGRLLCLKISEWQQIAMTLLCISGMARRPDTKTIFTNLTGIDDEAIRSSLLAGSSTNHHS